MTNLRIMARIKLIMKQTQVEYTANRKFYFMSIIKCIILPYYFKTDIIKILKQDILNLV